ncbi:hypothetical protein JEM45_06450 [Jeotgalicoccus sp. ATCC 8456]|nr:hypothetical protein JEM45_06450 [Jeotgalicoccus sp. ATCC 8456]
MLLSILIVLIYIVVSAATILTFRSKTLDIARLFSGLAFLIMIITTSMSLDGSDIYLTIALAICIVLSVEITAFKEKQGDQKNLFLIHAFTLTMTLVLIIMLITL